MIASIPVWNQKLNWSITNVIFAHLLANVLGPVILAELGYVPEGFDAPIEDAAVAVVVSGKLLEENK